MTADRTLRIGTRGSLLARTQTEWVATRLRDLGHAVEIETISTLGDVGQGPVPRLGGDGVFVRELQRALLEERIDLAVHSLKDLPTEPVEGLAITCVPERESPFDALVGRSAATLESLPASAVVGTSSVRRVVQVRRARPDVVIRAIRGNVDTRLAKLDAGEYDAIILAGAGLSRLGLADRITESLEPDAFWPAIGQGALAIEARSSDADTRGRVAPLNHPGSQLSVVAERACLASLAGGCLAPIGGFGRVVEGALLLGACVFGEQGGAVARLVAEASGSPHEVGILPDSGDVSTRSLAVAESLGRRVASLLEADGASSLLATFRRAEGGAS